MPAKKFKRVTVTCNQQLKGLKAALEKTKDLEPVNVADHVSGDINRYTMYLLMKSVKETGFPSIAGYDVYHYFLCSKGPHPAVHFIWKAANFTEDVDERNAEIVHTLRKNENTYFNRASRRAVKSMLHRIGVTKPHRAEYLIRTLLGDASTPNDGNQKAILQRFHEYISLGNDIICDLRMNNGAQPKFDAFWNIVKEFIESKTAIDDRRWGQEADGEIVTTMAMATTLSDIYRQCCETTTSKTPPVEVPSLQWFTLQFWLLSKSLSAITHYTGRFKVYITH